LLPGLIAFVGVMIAPILGRQNADRWRFVELRTAR
jgi:hypothetical protein